MFPNSCDVRNVRPSSANNEFPCRPLSAATPVFRSRNHSRIIHFDHTVANQEHRQSNDMASPRWQRGVSGNPAGRTRGSRNALSEEVICALLRDFREHGQKAIAQVRTRQPAAYLKVLALLVPREQKVDLTNTYEGLSTEQIEQYIAAIQDRIDRRAAGHQAKVIDGEAVETAAVATATPLVFEPPKRKRPNRLLEHVDTAVGPREHKPRKRKAPLPPGA
jgi:Family of unknown function (DUF5681)